MVPEKITVRQRQRNFLKFAQEQSKLLMNKGNDYTAGKKDEDSYANFRIIAELMDGAPVTPYTVAMIYMLKHVFSLITFAKTGVQDSGEGLEGRHLDISNYVFILSELVEDHRNWFGRQAEIFILWEKDSDKTAELMNDNDDPGPSDEDYTPYADKFDMSSEFVKVKDREGNWVSLDEFFRKEVNAKEDRTWP